MRKILLPGTCLLLLIVIGCRKSSQEFIDAEIQYTTLVEVKKALMENVIAWAKANPQFKKTVEEECLKQANGDYEVTIDKLLEINSTNHFLGADETKTLAALNNQMKKFRPSETPIIFVPVMETRDPKEAGNQQKYTYRKPGEVGYFKNNPNNYIVAVDRDNEIFLHKSTSTTASSLVQQQTTLLNDPEGPQEPGDVDWCNGSPEYYPGYIINEYGNLIYEECITEFIAWENDVWVFGYEEQVSPGNQVVSPYDYPSGARWVRNAGEEEYGGTIRIPDLGRLESWLRGKPEFKYFVWAHNGTLIREHAFGKLKRSNFCCGFIQLNDRIGTWDTSIWGPVQYERWIEEDGGQSGAISAVINYNINGITYSTTISSPSRDRDENMGLVSIFFTDIIGYSPIASWENQPYYSFNHMHMQRR